MSGAAYWNQRIAQVGHTGWSDPAVYAYDQRLRLAAVRDAIAALPGGAHAAALDFGCGVGDFCALLAPRYGRVVGYDSADEVLRRARARHSAANIAYTGSLDEATGGRYDLRVWSSEDEGATWSEPTVLLRAAAQYSMLTPLGDGTLGIVYESVCVCEDPDTGVFRAGLGVRMLRFDPERVAGAG
mgnify:CR=1 FL=1